MIDVLERLADAECQNCGGRITQFRGPLSGTVWSHEQTGTEYCPGAPRALPIEGTIVEGRVP